MRSRFGVAIVMTEAAQVAVAEIVGQNEYDAGAAVSRGAFVVGTGHSEPRDGADHG